VPQQGLIGPGSRGFQPRDPNPPARLGWFCKTHAVLRYGRHGCDSSLVYHPTSELSDIFVKWLIFPVSFLFGFLEAGAHAWHVVAVEAHTYQVMQLRELRHDAITTSCAKILFVLASLGNRIGD